jgi:hypothetical protein
VNRIGTEVAWKKGLTAGLLMLTLCAQLHCNVNEEAQLRLSWLIRGFYDGSRQALRSIKVAS